MNGDPRADYKPYDFIFEYAHEIKSIANSIGDRIEECDSPSELTDSIVAMEEARNALDARIQLARVKMTRHYFATSEKVIA